MGPPKEKARNRRILRFASSSPRGALRQVSSFSFLFSFSGRGPLVVVILQHGEGLLLEAIGTDETLAVPAVLHTRQRPAGRTEVAQDPRRGPAPLRDFPEHGERLPVEVRLVFLAEAGEPVGAEALLGVGAKFADDHRLVVAERPGDLRNLVGEAVIPADVLVEAEQVGEFAQRIVDDAAGGIGGTAM